MVGRSVHDGHEFLIVVQPDGTRTLLPAWMMWPESAKLTVRANPPRFPLATLANLSRELEAVLSLLPGSTGTGDNDEIPANAPSIRFVQQSGCAPDSRSFAHVSQGEAILLLGRLLYEIVQAEMKAGKMEGGNEQDHC